MKTNSPVKGWPKRWSIAAAALLSLFLFSQPFAAQAGFGANATFMVASDPHFFAPGLGVEGEAFETYLMRDRKMIAESEAIFQAFVESVLAEFPDFVIIPGDLTKDGEKASHEKIAGYLGDLEAAGIEVYVVPGNHDIDNPHAHSYTVEGVVPVESVTPEEFKTIYSEFGFDQAIDMDADSLSYVVEPAAGIRLLCLDSCKYDNNVEHPETSGAFSQQTLDWIVSQLQEARMQGKIAMAMMHHNLVEHFTGQSLVPMLGDEYVIDDWRDVSGTLSTAGLQIIFSGHHHAEDVTGLYPSGSGTEAPLYDVMTGSLVTYPCPFRKVSVVENTIDIESMRIEEIDYETGGLSFQEYALAFLAEGLDAQAAYLLQSQFGVSAEDAAALAPLGTQAITAYYQGDEGPSLETLFMIGSFLAAKETKPLGELLGSLWTDLPPADNKVEISVFNLDALDFDGLVYPHTTFNPAENTDTQISVVNTDGDSEANGQFIGYSEDGSIVYESAEIAIAPNGSHEFMLSTAGDNAASVSYMTFVPASGEAALLQGCARIDEGGMFGAAFAATARVGNGPIPLVHTASTEFWTTHLGLVNMTDETKSLQVRFDTGEIVALEIPPRGKVFRSIRELFNGQVRPDVGSGIVENGDGILATCVYQSVQGIENHYAAAVLLDSRISEKLYFPRIESGNDRATGIAIYNALDAPRQSTILPFDSQGNALDPMTVTVPARGKYVGVAETLGFAEDAAWFEVDGAPGLSGLELTVSIDGSRMSGFSAPASVGTEGVLPVFEQNGFTEIGLVNVGDQNATVKLKAFDSDGMEVVNGILALPPRATVQGTIDSLIPTDNLTQELLDSLAYATFSSTNPVIGYQVNQSADQMKEDSIVGSLP